MNIITAKDIVNWYDQGYSVVSDVKGLEGYVLPNSAGGISIFENENIYNIGYFSAKCGAYIRNGVVTIYDSGEVFAEYMGT